MKLDNGFGISKNWVSETMYEITFESLKNINLSRELNSTIQRVLLVDLPADMLTEDTSKSVLLTILEVGKQLESGRAAGTFTTLLPKLQNYSFDIVCKTLVDNVVDKNRSFIFRNCIVDFFDSDLIEDPFRQNWVEKNKNGFKVKFGFKYHWYENFHC